MLAPGVPFLRFRIEDRSMEPAFHEDDIVLVNRWAYLFHGPRPGDVVVLRNPEDPREFLLKRIDAVAQDGGVFVRGDNAGDSRDSRHFGAVRHEFIVGKVWWHARP